MVNSPDKFRRARVVRRPLFICLLVAKLSTILMAQVPAVADRDKVLSLIAYCRTFEGKVSLSPDKSILCYDGQVPFWIDLTPFRELSDGGLVVVRSPGGNAVSAVKAANVLRDKQATVVIYDYCLSACANAFFVATRRTLVADNAIVAWHGGVGGCNGRAVADPSDQERIDVEEYCASFSLLKDFFVSRGLDDEFTRYPQTRHTRADVAQALAAISNPRNVFWMWHPVNHRNFFPGVTYYKYPKNQAEVTSRLRALGLNVQVIYDIPILRYADIVPDRIGRGYFWCREAPSETLC
jgi:hypothetical protein